jgi:hypothetical protein
LNDGFSDTVSARALNIRFPIETSLAQEGTRPHRKKDSPNAVFANTGVVGAILYLDAKTSGISVFR